MKWKCSYPPCPSASNESKTVLERLGWTFKRGEVLCPPCAGIQALFSVEEVKRTV